MYYGDSIDILFLSISPFLLNIVKEILWQYLYAAAEWETVCRIISLQMFATTVVRGIAVKSDQSLEYRGQK